jgi:acyl-coenzyme A synthetase/AMP-(fatty) acid ligase
VTAQELQEHTLQYVTKFKKPRYVSFCERLPKSSIGKVLKRQLREDWNGRIGQ